MFIHQEILGLRDIRVRFLHIPRNGVVTAIVALAIADLLRVLRPGLIHPQSYVDVGTRLLSMILLFRPFLFGAVAPLETIFMRVCDPKLRKSYSANSFLIDMSWYIPLACAAFFSFRYV